MELKELTHTETLEHSLNEYNITEWRKNVNRFFNEYKECKFYEWIDTPNKYATIFAVYIADDIRFMVEVSYSLCLSNTGFTRFVIENGKTREIPFLKNGKKAWFDNCKENRVILREWTEITNWIFTTCWIG